MVTKTDQTFTAINVHLTPIPGVRCTRVGNGGGDLDHPQRPHPSARRAGTFASTAFAERG